MFPVKFFTSNKSSPPHKGNNKKKMKIIVQLPNIIILSSSFWSYKNIHLSLWDTNMIVVYYEGTILKGWLTLVWSTFKISRGYGESIIVKLSQIVADLNFALAQLEIPRPQLDSLTL